MIAKETGQGNPSVHYYYASVSHPGLFHRACTPTSRLWSLDGLKPQTPDSEPGWMNRRCSLCFELKAQEIALLGVL